MASVERLRTSDAKGGAVPKTPMHLFVDDELPVSMIEHVRDIPLSRRDVGSLG